ncbi:1,4-dihydroxy-2-naphthoate octaprenyltransferase [Prevotella sp. AM42-24]|uniref:1,4-dihydroxy-2-naphthoate octaprenyltransferase n=1 Tax=Prevotella sp. AM42-24 TaxID=2293125 RepID=UPI000E4E5AEE|nr:1,4-dihydroxy-2-naphthoate octaprenyltransferase [Prevotella sp. AM42-24]RGH42761.1 1,4-dihydroxy-2-naphthoate octaprenyltransferase [Prevotella sp. AM42-24]
MVKTNSVKAWLLATRPKTLSAAAVPVMIGTAFAWRNTSEQFNWIPAILCLLFAWIMQIDSNLVNDYFDFKKGNDDETRLGPKRACSEGWITSDAMVWGILITTLLGCMTGIPLILYGGLEMVMVGIACVVFCFLYTTLFSYHGLGDILVLLFFGIIPVCCTYYVCMPLHQQIPTGEVIASSIACGLAIDALLIVNNYRDIDNDRSNGKITLAVRLGESKTRRLYESIGYIAAGIMIILVFFDLYQTDKLIPTYAIYLIYIILHRQSYQEMKRINKGAKLNQVLGLTARNILVFGILSVAAILSVIFI